MLPKLKRTLAVACLLATACFVILWMRSFKLGDDLAYIKTRSYYWEANSSLGTLELRFTPSPKNENHGWFFMSYDVRDVIPASYFPSPELNLQNWSPSIVMPYSLLVAISGLMGLGLIIRRAHRFNLKSLAIAATAIIVTLGLGVAASRLTLG